MTQTVVNVPAAGAFDPTDIEITDNTSGAFLIKEGSNEYMRINTTNSAEQTIFANGSSNEYIKIDATSGQPGVTIKMPTGVPLRFQADNYQGLNASGSVYRAFSIGSANNWAFGDLTAGSPGHLRAFANDIRIIHSATGGSNSGVQMRARGAGTGDTFKIQSDTETNFEIDQDSNTTFTLDSSSTVNFKVVDDAGSPTTYLDIERGSTEKVKIPVVGLQTVRAIGGTYVLGVGNTNGLTFHTYAPNFQNHVPADLDQTDDGTTVALGYRTGATVTYGASATAAATTGITLTMQSGLVADGATSTQHLVLHNQNSTHSAKFILDGSAQYAGNAVATAGTDAADLIGSGFTLAAGKLAVFSIIGCRVENPSHYFYCVSLHTKT